MAFMEHFEKDEPQNDSVPDHPKIRRIRQTTESPLQLKKKGSL